MDILSPLPHVSNVRFRLAIKKYFYKDIEPEYTQLIKDLIVGDAAETLDTLKELADALDNDSGFYTTVTTRFNELQLTVEDNELITSAALNDLNTRKLEQLVSGETIKTINNESLLGSGNIDIVTVTDITTTEGICTITMSDGTTHQIDLPQGVEGRGILSVVLNADYTLTFNYTDNTSYTTPLTLRGEKGDRGEAGPQGPKGDTVVLGEVGEYKLYNVGGTATDGAMTQDATTKAIAASTGYYECSTAAGTAAKVAVGDNEALYTLQKGGSIKVKMANANAAASGVTLKIGSAAATPLYYNNEPVSASNTWEAGEVISVYFDGEDYQASNAQGGGGKAEKIKYDNSQSGLAAEDVQGALDIASEKSGNLYSWDSLSNYYYSGVCFGFITADGTFTNVTGTNRSKYTHKSIKVPSGVELFKIKATSARASYIYFVKEYTIPIVNDEEVVPCDGYSARITIPTGTVKEFKLPEDCSYIIIGVLENNVDYSPEYMEFGSTEMQPTNTSNVYYKSVFNDTIRRSVAGKNGVLYGDFFLQDTHTRVHRVIERDPRAKYVKVTSQTSTFAHIAFLKSYNELSGGRALADLCDDEIGTHIIPADTSVVFEIPDDCKLIAFNQVLTDNVAACQPSDISWGYDDVNTKERDRWLSGIRKTFKNTALGIIGDSLSTYKGCIMPNATTAYGIDYINGNNNYGPQYGVASIEDTWWKMFANTMGFGRIQNLSWGGSGVIRRETRPSLYERTLLLDDDCSMIIIALGANDAGQSQPISPTEDWEEYWDMDINALDESEFMQGLIKGIKQIQLSHPNSLLMLFCTSRSDTETAAPYTEAEVAAAEHFGLPYLNMLDFYTPFSPYSLLSDYHPSNIQMGFIYNGLMDYAKTIDFNYRIENKCIEFDELEFTTTNGSISMTNGGVDNASDTNRICTDFIDVVNYDTLLVKSAHLTQDLTFACYDADKNYIGYTSIIDGRLTHKLYCGTYYVRRSLTTTGQSITRDFKILAVKRDDNTIIDSNFIDIRLSDFMNPLQADQQNIDDCMMFASGFNKKVIHFDVERLTVSKAILLESNTTILLEDCVIKQADETFDNVFRSANLEPDGNGGQDMPSDIPILENIKIIGVGKANIIGPDVNASSGGNPLVGDAYGFRTWQICMVRAKDVEISNIAFTKTRCWCITFELCENVSVHDLSIRSNVKNGDGIDFRVGCKHCEVYNMFASTLDDAVACTALGTLAESTDEYCGRPTWKLWQSLLADSSSALDVEDISVRNIRFAQTVNSSLNGGHGMICLSAYGSKVHNVSVDSFTELAFGDSNNDGLIKIYHGYGSGYTAGDLNTIRLNDIVCTHFPYTLQVTGGIVEDVRANKLTNSASGGSTVTVSSGNVIGENVIVTNS